MSSECGSPGGGPEEGKRGCEIEKKSIVVVAAEKNGRAIGRIRLKCVKDVSAESLLDFIRETVELGAPLHTEGGRGYAGLPTAGYKPRVTVISSGDEQAHEAIPRVHNSLQPPSIKRVRITVLPPGSTSCCRRPPSVQFHYSRQVALTCVKAIPIFFDTARSLGTNKRPLERQSDLYPEHQRWTLGPVLFVTLNVSGGNNNHGGGDDTGAEFLARNSVAIDWLKQGFAQARRDQLAGIVIVMQANPASNILRPVWLITATASCSPPAQRNVGLQGRGFAGTRRYALATRRPAATPLGNETPPRQLYPCRNLWLSGHGLG
jgi:hypothetical protein